MWYEEGMGPDNQLIIRLIALWGDGNHVNYLPAGSWIYVYIDGKDISHASYPGDARDIRPKVGLKKLN